MTLEEQVQAEAKAMVEQYAFNAKNYALISINKIISLRVQPMEY